MSLKNLKNNLCSLASHLDKIGETDAADLIDSVLVYLKDQKINKTARGPSFDMEVSKAEIKYLKGEVSQLKTNQNHIYEILRKAKLY
jgi:hypothetical protein